jgi:hypothetical protein
MQLAGRKNDPLGQAAVAHHAQGLIVFATICKTASTRIALPAIQIGLDGTSVARLNVRHTLAYGEHFNAELVSGDARIGKKWHFAQVTAEIGATDPNSLHANERLASGGRRWFRNIGLSPALGFLELKSFHDKLS